MIFKVFFSSNLCLSIPIFKAKKGYLSLNLKQVMMNPTLYDLCFFHYLGNCAFSHFINIEA